MEITSEEFLNKIKKNEMYKPKVPEEMAIDLVSRIYGLEVTELSSMHSFHDQNFHIKVSKNHQNPQIEQVSDDGYTLKIVNTLKSNLDGHFDSVHNAMNHLWKKGLRVPQPIRTLEDKTWHLEMVPLLNNGDVPDKILKCGIQLLTYIPGTTVASITSSAALFYEWGSMLATFHRSLEDLECPALKCQPTFLDLKYFSFIRMAIEKVMEGTLYDDETKSIIQNILQRIPSEIEEHIQNLPQGFLHGDFNDHNILVQSKDSGSGNAKFTIDGILDFDEMHFGTYVWDLGMMLGHVVLAEKMIDPLEAAGYAIAGYRSSRSMSDLELSLLKTCMEGRLLMMALVSTAADKDPNNTYVAMLAPLQPKIEMLKRLAVTDKEDLLDMWNGILEKCRLNNNSFDE